MCYSVNNNNGNQRVAQKLKRAVTDKPIKKAVYLSGFSHPSMYILKQEQTDLIDTAKWGLVPSFISDEAKAKEYFINTLNAKSETIFEKVSYKMSIMPRRCIIPLSGFFEYMTVNAKKYPHYISLVNGDLFNAAGIYDNWVNKATGEITTTFSIITIEANPLMAFIHNEKKRQPLLLTNEDAENWLSSDLKEKDVVELINQPLGDGYMSATSISKISPKTTDVFSEKLVDPLFYSELPIFNR